MLDLKHDILPLKNVMYRLALRITLNSQEAEDVVQDSIIRIWDRRDELSAVDDLQSYALRIVRNMSIDRQRLKVNQTANIEGVDMPADSSIEHSLEQQEQLQSIRDAMQQLPEKQRTAMQLRDFEGRSYKEIADVMGVKEDYVKVCIFRARQTIKEKLTSFN